MAGNFINDARQIVANYFTQCEPYEQRLAGLVANRRAGIITEDYERTDRINCNNQMTLLRGEAERRLMGLTQDFNDDLKRRAAPTGAELDSADFRLLRSGLPMNAEEFCAVCERNADHETVLRAAGEYAAAHDMLPYFHKYYHTPAERMDAFKRIVKTAKAALAVPRQYSAALDDKHWLCVTSADAKILGSSAEYYKG